MKTKNLLKSLKRRLGWMLCLVALLVTSQSAWAYYYIRGDMGDLQMNSNNHYLMRAKKSTSQWFKITDGCCNWDNNKTWSLSSFSQATCTNYTIYKNNSDSHWVPTTGRVYGWAVSESGDNRTLNIYLVKMHTHDAGTVSGTFYVGDYVSTGDSWINFTLYHSSWGAAKVFFFKETSSTKAIDASWYADGTGTDKNLHANLGNSACQFTSSGTWYAKAAIAAENDKTTFVYANNTTNTATEHTTTLAANGNGAKSWTVSALPNATSLSATAKSTSQIDLTWAHNSERQNVMVVRYQGASPSVTAPSNGTSYTVDTKIGNGTVIFAAGTGQSKSDTGLLDNTTYTYYFYTVNNKYYSSGVSKSATTPKACTDPKNTDFTYTSSNVYTGSPLSADVKWNSGTGSGAITTYYTGVSPTSYNKSTNAPTAVGTYSITIDVAAGGNYCAKSGISLGNYSITCPTIAKPQISATKSNVCSGTGTTISTTTSTAFASYQLYNGSSKVGSSKTGTGSSLEFSTGNLTADATFTVVATPNVTGCSGDVTSDGVSVSVTPNASIGSVSLDSYALLVDATTEAHATDVVLGGTGGAGTWTANNPTIASIAEVNGKYIVTALSAGDATFTYSVSGGCGSDSKTTSTLTVSEPCREPVMQAKPTRVTASQSETSLEFRVFATDKGTCEISSWGLKVYSNAGCTTEVATINGVGELTTSSSATPLQATGLNANTKYWAKSFANHSGGTSWNTSDPTGWATKVALGTTSSTVNDCQSATLSSSSELGGSAVTTLASANFRYSTNQSEVSGGTGGTVVSSGVTTVGSDFSKQITGLTPNTTYYYRAEIEYNNTGAGGANIFTYSDVKSFKTNAASLTNETELTFDNTVVGVGNTKLFTFTYCGATDIAQPQIIGDNTGDYTFGTFTDNHNGTFTGNITFKPKAVGTRTVNFRIAFAGSFSDFTITSTALCIPLTKDNYTLSGESQVYDGNPKSVTITPKNGEPAVGTIYYNDSSTAPTNLGTYPITFDVAASGNYCAASKISGIGSLTISEGELPAITGLPTETVIICSGLTEQLNPVCSGATSFTYSSSATGVAIVDASGLITAVAAGDATITVTAKAYGYNDKSATVAVHVNTTPSVSIVASPTSVGPWEISSITVTPSAGTAAVELWKGGSKVSPTDADVVFEGSGTAYKLKAANKTASSIIYTVKAKATLGSCTGAESSQNVTVTKAATEVCQ